MQNGYVLMDRGMEKRQYISAIISNGHPEKPVVYWTDRLEDAKVWKNPKFAVAAAKKIGSGEVWLFEIHDGYRKLVATYINGFGLVKTKVEGG